MAGRAPNALVADHVDWDSSNNDPGNLVASCNNCNARRAAPGKRGAISDGEPTVMVGRYRTRAVERVCEVCSGQFFTVPSKPGRYCSRECWMNRKG